MPACSVVRSTNTVADPVHVFLAAVVVSEKVKQQILEQQQRMSAAEEAPDMSKPQTAALQRDIAAILLPGESVTKALQRLGKQDKRPAGVQRFSHHWEDTVSLCSVSRLSAWPLRHAYSNGTRVVAHRLRVSLVTFKTAPGMSVCPMVRCYASLPSPPHTKTFAAMCAHYSRPVDLHSWSSCWDHTGKRNKDLQPKIEQTDEEKQIAKQQFEKLTEAASSLMDSGELDVYSQKKVMFYI